MRLSFAGAVLSALAHITLFTPSAFIRYYNVFRIIRRIIQARFYSLLTLEQPRNIIHLAVLHEFCARLKKIKFHIVFDALVIKRLHPFI